MPPIPAVPPHTAGYFQAFFTERFGAKMGALYSSILSKDPSATPTQAAQALLLGISTKGVAGALAAGVGAFGSAITVPANPLGLGGTGGGSGAAAGDDWAHLFTRLAEFAIGATLIVVGVVAVVSKTKTGAAITGTAANVVGMAPPVREARIASQARGRAINQRAATQARAINKNRYGTGDAT
jgi:hypothetical protein